MLTQAKLKELLHYDPETGVFTWINSSRAGWNGKRAGAITKSGYFAIRIENKGYLSHRLAWLYMYGEFPLSDLDHIDTERSNCKIINLRIASRNENANNKSMYSNNTSSVKGVSWHKANKKWTAQINSLGKTYYLGSFKSKEEAEIVVRAKRTELHGEFARHE